MLTRKSVAMHGLYWREGDQLGWWQYWRGIRHTWYLGRVPVWTRLRRRHRPLYEMMRTIF